MTAGVRPRVVGAEPGSVFPTGIPLPRRQPGAEHTGSPALGTLAVFLLAAAPGTWGGDAGGGGPPAPAAPDRPLISPVRQQLCHQRAVRKFMLSNFLQLEGRQEARHRVLFVCPQA